MCIQCTNSHGRDSGKHLMTLSTNRRMMMIEGLRIRRVVSRASRKYGSIQITQRKWKQSQRGIMLLTFWQTFESVPNRRISFNRNEKCKRLNNSIQNIARTLYFELRQNKSSVVFLLYKNSKRMTFKDVDHLGFDRAGVTTLPGIWTYRSFL